MSPLRLPIVVEIAMVLMCWIVAGVGAIEQIGCIAEDNRDSVARICSSTSATTAYNAALLAAAMVSATSVLSSHVLGRRSVALLGCLVSLGLVAAAIVWGAQTRPVT